MLNLPGLGPVLTFLGMGIVFCFIMLIICISLLCKILRILDRAKDTKIVQKTEPAQAPAAVQVKNTAIIAAITAAVTEYRRTNS